MPAYIEWIKNGLSNDDSLDELIMALEEELLIEISDEFAERWNLLTLRDLVEHVYRRRRPPTPRDRDR